MDTKRYRITLATIAILVIIASTAAIYYKTQSNIIYKESIGKKPQFMYYLKEYDEKIGVYKTDEDIPFMTLEVYVSSLPYIDRVALEKGIEVSNEDKLKTLIEDYES